MKMRLSKIDYLPLAVNYRSFLERSLNEALRTCFCYFQEGLKTEVPDDFYRVFRRASQLGWFSSRDIQRVNSAHWGTQKEVETLVSWLSLIEELVRET